MNEIERLDLLTLPSERMIDDIRKIDGDIMILGCGGKIGPSLAIKAKRAIDQAGLTKKVVGVSLFDYPDAARSMQDADVQVIEADLSQVERLRSLPDIPNIIYMVGRKFGTYQDPSLSWAINVLLPAKVCEAFPKANYVVFTTGNIYGYTDIGGGGSCESEMPEPVREYGQTSLGRERVFEHFAQINQTKMLLFRLHYAIDLRYGVLFDLARNIMKGNPVNSGIGYFNCIWQGDVCEYAIRSILHCENPPMALNVTGPESISIRWAALKMGAFLGREPLFADSPDPEKSLFSNTAQLTELMGYPQMPLLSMMKMVAEWVLSGGATIDAPTHFESTDGNF